MRKTFITKTEATKYCEDMTEQGNAAVVGTLGDKFRVYVSTKENMDVIKRFRGSEYTIDTMKASLRDTAWKASSEIDDALLLQTMMVDKSLYSDYESTINAAKIMEKAQELRTARDVFNFIDNTQDFDKIMKTVIEETLDYYDYEAKDEVAKD